MDWDGNLDTLADRDIFMQIYNFEDNEFHYITRVTPESAAYTTPKFARSDNATYLFYGETAPESGTGTETELAEHGTIKYLDVTDLIKNEKYTKVIEGDTSYYVFEYSREEYMFDENGGSASEEPAEKLVTETIRPEALTAAECDNPMYYDVTVSADGQMYLFWTDTLDGSRQIMTAMYNGSDAIDDGADDNDPDADLSAKFWSEPVMLTASAEDTQYSGIGTTAVNGKLYALGAKGSYTDTSIPFTAGTKVKSDMKLYARWDENKGGTTSGLPFTDVSQNDWFYDAVKYVYSGKLFSGVSDTEFAPNSPLTRAMLVTVLWRAEGKPYVNYAVSFDDTDENAYYFEALRWAASEKIVEGISDTEFAPDANITREQIAAIMFRYAKFKNIVSDGEQAENLDYIDKNQISGWAAEAVSFCKQLGIMTGDDTNSFNPKNSATRAETAAITQRFSEKLNNN